VIRAGWDKIISDNLDTERKREREREKERKRSPCHQCHTSLSHLIIMAMLHTLQINVREEKASPSPPQTPKSG
jgi:hypothetical protein